MVFSLIIIVPFIIYIFGLLLFILGNLKQQQTKNQNYNPNISVIVAVRDGAKSLSKLLSCLQKQIYKGKIDFIIVDDQSSDDTKDIIINFCKTHSNFKYVSSIEGNPKYKYKKRALDAGINHAKYDPLLFTDVDCRPTKYWVSSMACNFDNNVDYIIGPVAIDKPKNLVALYQSIDLNMLIVSLYGITSLGLPCASTGQNQGFKKSIYKKVSKFDKIGTLLGGDDSLFLNIVRRNLGKIKFVVNESALVYSRQERTIKKLINQRMRWALDANLMYKFNFRFYVLMVCTLLTNLIVLTSPIIYIYSSIEISLVIMFKFLFEILLFMFSRNKISIINFLFWFTIQPLYVVVVGVYSIIAKDVSWKDRKYVT